MSAVITLFGSPEITRDGASQHPDTRKALAVLAYLAVEGPTARRDRLAWLLWPESSQERARATLRRTLTSLRSAIGANALSATRESITLELDAVDVDVARFQSALADGDHQQAASLYKGEFLQGFSLRDAPDFDDWQRLETDGFRTRIDAALAVLMDVAIAGGTPAVAADLALRRIELDGLNEEARRSLMLVYAQLGRRADAITAYRGLVRTLDEELGVAPLPATVDLYEAIRRGDVTIEPRVLEPAPVVSLPTKAPLVGRDEELARFDAHLATGQGGVVWVLGGPGSGKTALLDEMGRRATADRRKIARVRCFEGERGLTFAPVAELLRTAVARTEPDQTRMRDVGRLLPEYRQRGEEDPEAPTDGPGSRLRLFDSWSRTLLDNDFDHGVLMIDDIHHADTSTREFLAYLANRADALGVTVVLASEASGDLPTNVATLILELTRPDGVVDERRSAAQLAALDPSARQVIEGAAVIDRAFDVDLLQSVVGRSGGEVAELVDSLLAAAMLQTGPGDTIELAHPVLRDAANEGMSPVRRRLLHRRTAEALEGNQSRQGEAATHYQAAGDRGRAAELHVAAADVAMATFANSDALGHVRSALALGHEARPELHEIAGDLETLEGRYRNALHSYETAAAIGESKTLARVEHKLGMLHLRLGDPATAQSHLASALIEVDPDDYELRAQILTTRASAEERSQSWDTAARIAAEAVAAAARADALGAEASARCVAGVIALAAERLDDAREHYRAGLRLAEVGRTPAAAAAAHNGLGLLCLRQSDYEAALGHFEAAITLLERLGDRHRLAAALSNLADAHHAAGRESESMAAMKRSAALLADIGGDPLEGQAGVWGLTGW